MFWQVANIPWRWHRPRDLSPGQTPLITTSPSTFNRARLVLPGCRLADFRCAIRKKWQRGEGHKAPRPASIASRHGIPSTYQRAKRFTTIKRWQSILKCILGPSLLKYCALERPPQQALPRSSWFHARYVLIPRPIYILCFQCRQTPSL